MDKPSINLFDKINGMLSKNDDITRYSQGDGPVRYMDGSSLNRPITMPVNKLPIALAFAAVAAVIGIVLAVNLLGSTLHAAQRSAASVEENLAREVSLDMPLISSYAGMDAASIKSATDSLGLNVYTVSSDEDIATGKLDMVKMPSDVSVEEGAMYYAQGISNLDAPDAALLLNGMWRLQFDSTKSYNLSIRYADFDSGNVDTAVENAIAAQGFDTSTATELDVDDAGNTFRSGTLEAGGATYNWRVSAIGLDAVYDISGLPDTAIYVGVRMTAA